ncbi:MAG TPA: hypothetical protein VIU61_09550 [Kofleriaceae bacterium]
MLRVVLVALASLVLVACRGGSDGPPCGAVAASFNRIANADLARAVSANRVDESTRRAVLDQIPAMRDSLLHTCSETKWSREVRTCLASAPDHVAFQNCQAQLTDAQRAALDRSALGKPDSL